MPTTTNKQRLVNQLFTLQKKRSLAEPESRPVLETFLYAICREGTTSELANRAYRSIRQRFFDWNEVRVSSAREVEEVLADLPDAELRAQRLISLLQEVFETTFSFDLEILHKKGLKQAAKQLARYQAASDFAVAWVIQHSLAGHALPLDSMSLRVLRRLGMVEEDQEDMEALRASLEHLIPKAKGAVFCELLNVVANDCCWEADPNCPRCPMASECPIGQSAPTPVGAGRGSRPKPR